MEAKKRKNYQYEYDRTSYVDGNTARKLNVAPDIRREEQQYELPSRRRQEQIQPKTLSGINFVSLLVLVAAIFVTVYMCFEYLQLQTDVSRMNSQISTLGTELTTLTKKNDATMDQLNAAVDLDKIYHLAVEEYGMVYPNENTVITYESSDENFVRQYEDIPQ